MAIETKPDFTTPKTDTSREKELADTIQFGKDVASGKVDVGEDFDRDRFEKSLQDVQAKYDTLQRAKEVEQSYKEAKREPDEQTKQAINQMKATALSPASPFVEVSPKGEVKLGNVVAAEKVGISTKAFEEIGSTSAQIQQARDLAQQSPALYKAYIKGGSEGIKKAIAAEEFINSRRGNEKIAIKLGPTGLVRYLAKQQIPQTKTKEIASNKPENLQLFMADYYAKKGWGEVKHIALQGKRSSNPEKNKRRILENKHIKEATDVYKLKYGTKALIEAQVAESASILFAPARAIAPDVELKDIKPMEWGVGAAQVALLAIPFVGSVGGRIGIQAVAGGVFTADTVQNWKAMTPIERTVAVGIDTIIERAVNPEVIDYRPKSEMVDVFIKYTYEKRPEAKGAEVIDTTRPFCKRLIELDRVYSRQEIETISQRLGYSVFDRAGGFWGHKPQCRHEWRRLLVIKKK